MRELYKGEMNMVAAAGVVTDDPAIDSTLDVFDKLCGVAEKEASAIKGSMLDTSIDAANTTVHGATNVMDTAFTGIFNIISGLLKR